MNVKYNDLGEGYKLCAVVAFEEEHGEHPHNLLNLAMTELNSELEERQTHLKYHTVDANAVKNKAAEIVERHRLIRESLGIFD